MTRTKLSITKDRSASPLAVDFMILLNEWREPAVLASVDKLFQLIAPLYLKLLLEILS